MLDRIVMNVIEMTLEVQFIPNGVFPEAFLPKLHVAGYADGLFLGFGKIGLEGMHDLAEVAVSGWFDEQVEVVR